MTGVKTWDVIVIGGGIIGLSLAIALKKRGTTVLVVERGEPGREASYAAGGMIVDCAAEIPTPLHPLAVASARLYPEFAHELEIASGTAVDLRDAGTILFPSPDHPHESLSAAASLSPAQISELEPALANHKRTAFLLKERSIDPRALAAAAAKTARVREVDFSSGDAVTNVDLLNGRAAGVTTAKTSFSALKIVNCAGCWSGQISPVPLPTRPIKGQMLCLIMQPRNLLKHVVRTPDAYLIPRSDGRLLVGASVEEAGFDKRTDVATIQHLHRAAVEIVPGLKDAKILEDWAGLRPGTPDALPILGATAIPGYYVATGHFRDGILLAPITAQIMADVIEGRNPGYELAPFSASRFT